jgi:hypothetical protein
MLISLLMPSGKPSFASKPADWPKNNHSTRRESDPRARRTAALRPPRVTARCPSTDQTGTSLGIGQPGFGPGPVKSAYGLDAQLRCPTNRATGLHGATVCHFPRDLVLRGGQEVRQVVPVGHGRDAVARIATVRWE